MLSCEQSNERSEQQPKFLFRPTFSIAHTRLFQEFFKVFSTLIMADCLNMKEFIRFRNTPADLEAKLLWCKALQALQKAEPNINFSGMDERYEQIHRIYSEQDWLNIKPIFLHALSEFPMISFATIRFKGLVEWLITGISSELGGGRAWRLFGL